MDSKRRKEHQRNEKLEELLRELNDLLGPIEEQIVTRFKMPKYPVLLVMGVPRCGSTLVMQWLAYSGKFAYPTNLLSRFYAAPFIGAKIQQLLTAPVYNFNNEIPDFNSEISFESKLGKTKGALEPNEFWYFWRRFIPNKELRYVDEESLKAVDDTQFAAELAAIEAVFGKPLALKGLILELNIFFLSRILERALFLFIKRHPFYNIQSLLESRVRYFGDRRAWYSIKPKEYDMLKDLDPIEQVAGQVYYTNRAIEDDLCQIDASRGLTVSYEQFCGAPEKVFDQILVKFAQQGFDALWDYDRPPEFRPTNQIRLPEADCDAIIRAYECFSGVELTL